MIRHRHALALLLAAALLCGPRPSAAGKVYADLGGGGATYRFLYWGNDTTFRRDLVDAELGILRPLPRRWPLRLGSSLSLQVTPDRSLTNSYSLLVVDLLKLEYASSFPLRVRAGLGLARVFAPVNEIAVAASGTLLWNLGPVAVGVKTRIARFEVDYEPHATRTGSKYQVIYVGAVLSRVLRKG